MIIRLTFHTGFPIYVNSAHLVSFWKTEDSKYTNILYSVGEGTDLVVETPEEICEILDEMRWK